MTKNRLLRQVFPVAAVLMLLVTGLLLGGSSIVVGEGQETYLPVTEGAMPSHGLATGPAPAEPAPAEADVTEALRLAPLNPDFIEYLDNPPESSYGYIPPTMDLSHLRDIPARDRTTLAQHPSAFDWRDSGKVTPVKNQNPCGTCWIFGPLAAIESRVLIVEDMEYDFSEQNVACCIDPSWVYLIGDRCDGGGTSFLAAELLTKKGTRLETCDPYNPSTIDTESCDDTCATIKRITGYRQVADSAGEIAEVKDAVYNYGPVSMAYRHDDARLYDGSIYYWPHCIEDPDHLVCIVGWDDTIPHPFGLESGAWIVKNSWGTGWGDNGYFYLCYGSGNMQQVGSYRYQDYNPGETLYYWDEAGIVDAAGYDDSSAWMASVFTTGQSGDLTHVEFWTTDYNAGYELYVYDGFFGTQLASQAGTCEEWGYYSIPLDTPVERTTGQQFTVAVKMTTPGYYFPLPVEYWVSGVVAPPIQSGVCFVRHLDWDPWEDVADYGDNVCLRARITTAPPAVTTNPATDVTADSATLNGSLDDLGTASSVDVSFQWGETTDYGNETPPQTMTAPGAFSGDLTDLEPNTTYHFRAKAVGNGASYGDDTAFSTESMLACRFLGTVQSDGMDVPDDTVIAALIEGDTYTTTTPAASWPGSHSTYDLTISPATNYDEGTLITFMIGDDTADQTATWVTAGELWLNLTAGEALGYRDIPLGQGWNLVGLPLVPADSSVEVVLAGITGPGGVQQVYAYDPVMGWIDWMPVVGGVLTDMVDSAGYWIYMDSAAVLRVEGYCGLLFP